LQWSLFAGVFGTGDDVLVLLDCGRGEAQEMNERSAAAKNEHRTNYFKV
jgi:hypothetical protein